MNKTARKTMALLILLSLLGGLTKPSLFSSNNDISEAGTIELVSKSSSGSSGNGESEYSSTSLNGQYVAFMSEASNLVSNDHNDSPDIFVHDRALSETIRISVNSSGAEGNGESTLPDISTDGKTVVFLSFSTNFGVGENSGILNLYLHDRENGETQFVAPVFTNTIRPNIWADYPRIASNGRYIAFVSFADTLVPDDRNSATDVFVFDIQTDDITLVSIASDGTQGNSWSITPSISDDGRLVAFHSAAWSLIGGSYRQQSVLVRDILNNTTIPVSVASDGTLGNHGSRHPSISGEGRYVAFTSWASNLVPDDTNETWDVFVHDLANGETTRVSVAPDGTQGNDISWEPSISANGRFVAFKTYSRNLVPGSYSSGIVVHDRVTKENELISVGYDGSPANHLSRRPNISYDGRFVSFTSKATNLVREDTNEHADIFVYDRGNDIVEAFALIYLPLIFVSP